MTSLYIDRRGVEIELESEAIVFRENGARVGTVPIAPLSRIFMRGDVHLTAALLGKLGEHGIGIVVLSGRQGKPSLLLARPHNDATRRVRQIQLSLDAGFCLDLARRIVIRKLTHQMQWFQELREKDMQARYELSHVLRLLATSLEKLPGVSSLAELRGLEGSAAACYFDGLRAVVPESLNFRARNRRPPRDPFNALLSLSYTLVHAELAIALYGAGFDPYVGFYHQLDFGRESLASDLLEPLRPLADRFALGLIKKQILDKAHFSTTEAGCFLGKAGRAHFYAAYEAEKETLRHGIQREIEWLFDQTTEEGRAEE
ncbi:MAG: CRISPR-associated endonuclease Cas1 [Zoogloeaceae bacterium]|jgi:CRISPR-associated protein Cas1|nr:CRISPR-associated endonuclease Cas1 [Zoogloeaceae bacterium]